MKQFKNLPPGPFHYETTALPGEHDGKGHVYIVDANGRKIGVCWGPADTKLATANMIIQARAHILKLETSGNRTKEEGQE